MDLRKLSRLLEVQDQALDETDEKINQWNTFEKDYVDLKDRLQTLPEKITHDIMVPFGSVAFMPGKLVHTNEIMVLLGDNWFAERSAKQACDIIDRRLAEINQQLCGLKKQKDLLLSRKQYTEEVHTENSEFVEIREEYNKDKEKAWREKHRQLLETNKKAEARSKMKTDEEVFSRLDELSSQERLEHEFRMMDLEETHLPTESEGNHSNTRTVRFEDEIGTTVNGKSVSRIEETLHTDYARVDTRNGIEDEDDSYESLSITDDDSDTAEDDPQNKVINFQHSPREDSEISASEINETSTGNIQSPADIYHQFSQQTHQTSQQTHQTPKSILKSTSQIISDKPEIKPDKKMKTILPGSTEAFSGSVSERRQNNDTSDKKLDHTAPPGVKTTNQLRPVSKFKAQRMKKL